ncbi:hypothetical protein [Borrelia persica]|uniref:hypothetical protein n=1 Tax=Borrelia persica TaxID=44448 RepID=UPI000465DF39|nr:hypothetical protein [Borrelia persica]
MVRIMKNVFFVALLVMFSCNHNKFIKPSSGLIQEYALVNFGGQKYYYVEEFPINFELIFKFVDSQTKSTSSSQVTPLPGGYQEVRHSSSTGLGKSNEAHIGKVSVLVNSKHVGKSGIKTLKELNESLKKDSLGSLDVKFAFVVDLDKSLLKRSLIGDEFVMLNYKELGVFKDALKNTSSNNDSINFTLALYNEGPFDSKPKLSYKTYDKYDNSLKKFTYESKHKDGNEFYFEIKGSVASFASMLENIVNRIKAGL